MEFRFSKTFVVLVLSIYFVNVALAMPRTAERRDEAILDQSVTAVEVEKTTDKPPLSETTTKLPYARIPCYYDEATEDYTCQKHCIPKGYSYGLCVNRSCSCI